MSAIDRRIGVYLQAAIKLPCRVATTANITLDGLQTVDGVALASGDRVLVKNQTTASANGIYVADTGLWQRSRDFNGPHDAVEGSLVLVIDGTGGDTVYQLTTADPVIGTSNLTFAVTGAAALATVSAFMLTVLDDTTDTAARATLNAAKSGANTDITSVYLNNTGLKVKDTNASHGLSIVPGSDLTADRTFTVTTGDASRALTLTGDASLAGTNTGDFIPRKYVYGLTYTNGTDATNDIDIAAGGATSDDGAYFMTPASTLTKRLDAGWVVGTGNGGLDTGSIANADYYIWLIARSDTGVVDALFSLSSTAPTMPTNYDFKRLIGWFKRASAAIVAFTTHETEGGGLDFRWSAPTLDINVTNTLNNVRRTDAVKVPLNFSVLAHLTVNVVESGTNVHVRVMSPDETDAAVSASAAPLPNMLATTGGLAGPAQMVVRTSATGTIAARTNNAGTLDGYNVTTTGFIWSRR